MTDFKALSASLRVIGDELITISELIYSPMAAPAEPAQDPNQAFQQPPVQQQTATQPAPTTYAPPARQQAAPQQQQTADDGFRHFSDQLVQLGRQAGPRGLGPIMSIVMPKYAPGGQGIAQVPPHNREPLLSEVRAYVAQQQTGGQQ